MIRDDRFSSQILGDLLSLPDLDLAGFDQRVHHVVEQIFRHVGRAGDAARVQGHVTLLDTVGGKRSERREVLCQADCGP